MKRKTSALMGALTADAAGLGLHWLNDVDRMHRSSAMGQQHSHLSMAR